MKATGIVRRIDELGRIVIPKEIRRNFRIKEGTPLEIYSGDEGSLMLKKYSPMMNLVDFAVECVDTINEVLDCLVLLSDNERILAGAGESRKEFIDRQISLDMEKVLDDRKTVLKNVKMGDSLVPVVRDTINTYFSQIIVPIISDGFSFGSIILLGNRAFSEGELQLVKSMAIFLAKQII